MTIVETQRTLGFAPYEPGAELSHGQWKKLEEGQYVIIQRLGEPVRAGEIDILNYHATIFWVQIDGGGRVAVYEDDGTRVWLPKGCRL
ncbi:MULTISPECIES: hypothetical protein [Arthrobacter]|uniref:Uncharacterized protein n=1 Tax=Arthrobacter terricola TaxID=2547396 RepID=A0A4R5KQ21_9MICC|nr:MULTISPECIES: hypothetical protein [Arthrobacter]MBT8160962.1 hypothetical protein [Arthrobacter sp. GN70]TDF96827.1 hypothetical protein E1809_08870 [Arthrobacter terricola]